MLSTRPRHCHLQKANPQNVKPFLKFLPFL
uniref:Uncharacterized protein n=1 Tax=Arundo donax TaxID=35708 RepID=A0A0A8Y3E3_ARUDO